MSEDVQWVEPHYIKRFAEKYACALSETLCAVHIGGNTTNPNYGNRGKGDIQELDELIKGQWRIGKWLVTYHYMRFRNWFRVKTALKRYHRMERN